MAMVMEAKTNDCRKKYEEYRSSTNGKGDNDINKEGKYEDGTFYRQWVDSERLMTQKNSDVRRKGVRAALWGLLGIGGAAFTLTSFLTVLPFAGVTFGLAGLGGVAVGLIGAVAGGILAKIGIGKMIENFKIILLRNPFNVLLGHLKIIFFVKIIHIITNNP